MLLAEKLLNTLYELEAHEPSYNWSDDKMKSNPPRYIRYRMAVSMLIYLGYHPLPESFIKNPFNRELPEDDDLAGDLTELLRSYGTFERFWELGDVCMTFLYLYNFRKRLHHAFTDDLIVMGVGRVTPGMQIMKQIRENIMADVVWIDRFLFKVVDPLDREFSRELLIDKYDYPTEDLEEVDLDWI